ncbi:MAG TPA: hypothetical protein VF503_16280 [Sphingobium sp.]|uniref:hypothetical protein n=1 Tax=Sphingobium sp. TaxID=1912891 RepID=UPI002ED63725
MLEFVRQNWTMIAGAIGALFAGGFVVRLMWARSGRDTNIVNQKGVSAKGDVVGRDKIVRETKRP